MQLVENPCPVCGCAAYSVVFQDSLVTEPPVFGYKLTPEVAKSYRFVRCRECHHIYASPRLCDRYRYYVGNVDETYMANAPLRTATARQVLKKIIELRPGGRLIDIGCGNGDFLPWKPESSLPRFAALRGIKDEENLADLAPQRGLVSTEAVKSEVGEIGNA